MLHEIAETSRGIEVRTLVIALTGEEHDDLVDAETDTVLSRLGLYLTVAEMNEMTHLLKTDPSSIRNVTTVIRHVFGQPPEISGMIRAEEVYFTFMFTKDKAFIYFFGDDTVRRGDGIRQHYWR